MRQLASTGSIKLTVPVRSYARGDLDRMGSLLMSYPAALETYRWLRETGRLPPLPETVER